MSHQIYFSQRLRVAMARANIKAPELAKKIGVSHQFVWMMMTGKKFPSSSNLVEICKNLDVSLDWIMEGSPVVLIAKQLPPRVPADTAE